MKKIKLISKDTELDSSYKSKHALGDTWMEQIECFYEFLMGQGYMITYGSFLEQFGDIVEDHHKVYTDEDKGRKKDPKKRP